MEPVSLTPSRVPCRERPLPVPAVSAGFHTTSLADPLAGVSTKGPLARNEDMKIDLVAGQWGSSDEGFWFLDPRVICVHGAPHKPGVGVHWLQWRLGGGEYEWLERRRQEAFSCPRAPLHRKPRARQEPGSSQGARDQPHS